MPSTPTRRAVLRISGVAVSLGIAGCSSGASSGPGVSNETAKERALAAEESHLAETLGNVGCLDEWGTTATTASKRATISNRSSDGVYVAVTHPYWYYTDEVEADGSTNALYVVTAETTERKRGDPVHASC